MGTEVDIAALASFASVPEATITTLLDSPTVDLVKSLLKGIEAKLTECEQVKAQKVRLEVELETAVRTSESKTKVLRNSVEKALAETSKLRVEVHTAQTERTRLESEIEQIRSTTVHDATETTTLRSRISSLEAANRDTVAVLESKTTAYDKLSQELSTQYQKGVDLRKQISSLEQSLQAASSAAASAKFKEQTLTQELDLLKKNNEWFENELKTKSADYLKFRKDKSARISELTRSNEQYIAEAEALRRSEAALRSRLDDQIHKLEEAMQDLQRLREERISDADSFRVELESAARLAELQKASADTAKERAQELSMALEEAREEAAEEIGKLRAEAETEHGDKEAAEARVAELEGHIRRLESELDQVRAQPVTPHRSRENGTTTPLRPGTPTGVLSPAASLRIKGNLTMTQMFAEFTRAEREVAVERRLRQEAEARLETMLQDLEAYKPEMDELRNDHARLQAEVVEMSKMVQAARQDREAALKEARTAKGQAESEAKESAMLSQQIRDLNSQVKTLLMEQQFRESGVEPTAADLADLRRIATNDDLSQLSDTGRVISEGLVTFRNIAELQARNANMLNMLRTLGEQMESNEAREKEARLRNEHEELEAARVRIEAYKSELQSMVAQSKSYIKERDMFRSMLTRRGQLPADANDFSRSMPLPAGASPAHASEEGVHHSGTTAASDYAKLLKDLQAHFDSYRQETATDQLSLKNQVSELAKRNSQLQTDASRAQGQLSAATQRCEMLQETYSMLKSENAELQKRSYAIMENASKQEVKFQQAAEELVETRGLLDSMRRDSANLKAEKDLWKNIERRLIEDNESLRNERARLDQLNSNLQSLFNEREQSDAETRRRLQASIDSLEAELQTAKRQLNEEREESKRATARREYEHEQNQKRIDDLVASLASVREELIAVKSSRDHLQAKVDELTADLRSAEERIAVLTQPTDGSVHASAEQEPLSREQELEAEVSDLQRDLELKTSELNQANEQVEVYRNISQQSEERLAELAETDGRYREEMEMLLVEKDDKIKDLQQRVEDITSELSTTNSELSRLRDEQSESGRRLEEQKANFEADVARIRDLAERNAEQAQYNLEASKAQAEIATEAQQNYEQELLKHAEAAKTLQTVRAEANHLRLEMTTLKSQAETAQTSLVQREESWAEMKDRYERELTDLKQRRQELTQQNTLLHNQLEDVTKQITTLQRDRAATTEAESNSATGPGLENLQEVIKYLRREKEIVDVQYHLSTQEAKRLRQQLDFVQSQLDETRLKLDQQQRAETNTEREAMSHGKMMEMLAELNLFRESSVTLRAEAKRASQALTEKTQRVDELMAQIEPLQARIAELENLSELREGEMKLLQEDRDHWQQRTQNILSKYDRVDPAELESLKKEVEALKTERDEAFAVRDSLQVQVDGIDERIKTARTTVRDTLAEQFKSRSKEMSGRVREKQTELDNANAEKASLQNELDAIKQQLDSVRAQGAAGEAPTVNGTSNNSGTPETNTTTNQEGANARIQELETRVTELEAVVIRKEAELTKIRSEHDDLKKNEHGLKERLNKRLAEVKTEAATAKTEALQQLRDQLEAEHQQALEALRAQSVPVAPEVQKPSEAGSQGMDTNIAIENSKIDRLRDITDDQARWLVQNKDVVRAILRQNIKKSVEKETEKIREQLAAAQPGAPTTSSIDAGTDQAAELQKKFAMEKELLVQQKEQQCAVEKETLKTEYEERFRSEKAALLSEQEAKLVSAREIMSKDAEKRIASQTGMNEKRLAAKMSMTENRARMAAAQIDVVKKAAEETPQKPVIEVWNIAKDAKPAPVVPPQQKAPVPPTATATDHSAATTDAPENNSMKQEASDQATLSNGVADSSGSTSGSGGGLLKQLQSGLPRGGSGRGGRAGARAVTQPAPSQTSASHEAPQQAAPARGTGIPRAGFRGNRGGRGGNQNFQTNLPQSTSRGGGSSALGNGSPRGNLNPQASQFQPGKRPRDDSETQDESMGKRIRGASGSS